ncbi:MAG: cysteine--tRNA ligase, partial [Cytophagales bacterium]|nr:cysteine--tRNA ligase [Cytophagales bacterium]
PLNEKRIGIYLCGPTVYSHAHLGHARNAITFDILIRFLKYRGYDVKFIRNYTDVGHLEHDSDCGEDKILKQSRLENTDPEEIVQRYINSYRNDMELLNITKPNVEPKATECIREQIDIAKEILAKGFAYESNNSIYFDVIKYEKVYGSYGELSGRKIEDLIHSQDRSLVAQEEKNNIVDFALWKSASPKHIMQWDSPWGKGFPGWHTECVALSKKFLGNLFDVHGGGMDLKFPHHEAELAQSRVLYDSQLANIWMHNNLINIDNQKMSKSAGNFITLQQLFAGTEDFKAYDPMVLRFFVLQCHYGSTISFSFESLDAAEKGYHKLMNSLKIVKSLPIVETKSENEVNTKIKTLIDNCFNDFNEDLNTAKVISNLFNLVTVINDIRTKKIDVDSVDTIFLKFNFEVILEEILGFNTLKNFDDSYINIFLKTYRQAKENKNYNQVMFLRDEMKKLGISIVDIDQNNSDWEFS